MAAFRKFRWVLEYPSQLESQQWSDALDLFAQISAAIAGQEFADKIRQVANNPENPNALYALGYELIEQSLPGIAATVLARAYAIAPGSEVILTELSTALEMVGLHLEACQFLRAAPELLEESFLCRYLLAFNSLMTGDLDEPSRLLPLLQQSRESDYIYMTQRIAGMLQRADVLRGVARLNQQDLRGWHFVVNGTLLLHLSPYGFNEGMNGRYAYIQDSNKLILEGIQRLLAVLNAWNVSVPRVFVLPDRNSAILAHAVAQVLHCPLEEWSIKGSQSPGLIVAYDLEELTSELLLQLHEHRPGQLLWSHATCWTKEPPFAADLQTYLYQTNISPWEKGTTINAEPDTALPQRLSSASNEELATHIVESIAPESLNDLQELVAISQAVQTLAGPHAAGAFRQEGQRRRQENSSPVASSRFL